jgi:hypothetical protein
MGLVRKAGGGSQVPAGEKLRFGIVSAEPDEGDHGPQVKFKLKVLEGPYRGEEITEWAKVGQDEATGQEYVADGGKLYNIAVCVLNDPKKLDSFDSVDDLAEGLVGGSFVSITKPRGSAGKYVGITWDMVYVDRKTSGRTPEEDLTEQDIAEMNYAIPSDEDDAA